MTDLRRRFVEQLRRDGAPLTPQLAAAFRTVPREAFVTDGFQRRDGTWVTPDAADFLDIVYRDDVLVTKVDGATPVSSSSQPSLMAIMLVALDVRPGHRVLEIGAGTGYNAALLSALGADVTSIDVQPDVAGRARAALTRAGARSVRVHAGDGYAGAPGDHFDRVVVTVGVAGVSPHWLRQIQPPVATGPQDAGPAGSEGAGPASPEGAGPASPQGGGPGRSESSGRPGSGAAGLIVVPVEHAGTHPVLAVRGHPDGPVTASVVCPSGFMSAAGPLAAGHPRTHPAAPPGALADFAPVAPARWVRPLDSLGYRDLWYAAGVWSIRATHAPVIGHNGSTLVLLDETGTGGAAILPDGAVAAGGPQARRYAAEAADIVDRWEAAGRPPMQAWRITLALAGDPGAPIWCPAGWTLDVPRAGPDTGAS
ncbi:methyltransferase domain-containing protein [Couchioplanes caeruleus]|uniref:methyltransferase domain-containing protein n=1 Tax=Couchioplanes caeruleus TaxID=56438 RepID=UPI0020C0F16E|nr:methyltransferase domain-containing protein [Couchioplanes caeruleus]UQU67071.1 methyltransferase domain-containing protein [Couchioplanes caeruleus]